MTDGDDAAEPPADEQAPGSTTDDSAGPREEVDEAALTETAFTKVDPDTRVWADPEPGEAVENEAVVEKRRYCQRCRYFTAPPDVGCSYSGGEVVELVGTDRLRVRNCPVVERRAADEDADGPD